MHYRTSEAWQLAMDMSADVLYTADRLPFRERFRLRLQITRAAVSVPSNIAEGWTREHPKEKAQFLAIAQGSLAELHTQLELAARLQWIPPEDFDRILDQIDRIGRILTVLRRKYRTPTAQ